MNKATIHFRIHGRRDTLSADVPAEVAAQLSAHDLLVVTEKGQTPSSKQELFKQLDAALDKATEATGFADLADDRLYQALHPLTRR